MKYLGLQRWEYGSNSSDEIVVPTQPATWNNWRVFQGEQRLCLHRLSEYRISVTTSQNPARTVQMFAG